MRECLNKRGKYYSGKENTPLGKGYSASGEKIGTKMRGRNGNMYEVVKYRGGKRWQKVRNVSPRGYEIFENVMIKENFNGLKIDFKSADSSVRMDVEFIKGKHYLNVGRVYITGLLEGLGLCTPLLTYLLMAGYNTMIDAGINNNYIQGTVNIESKVPEKAKSCYKNAYKHLGFEIFKELDDVGEVYFPDGTVLQQHKLVFRKYEPEDGWKKIDNIIHFPSNRENIMYIISTNDGISVVTE